MSTSTPAQSQTDGSRTGAVRSHVRTAVSWVFQIVGAGLFFNFGLGKVTGSNAAAVETFDLIGGDGFRVIVGSLEILGGIGLLIPMFAGVAAVCLAVLTLGATIVTLVLGGGVFAPVLCCVVAVVVVVFRRRTILAPLFFMSDNLPRRQPSAGA